MSTTDSSEQFPLDVDDGITRTPESLASDLIEKVYFGYFGCDSKSLNQEIKKSGKDLHTDEMSSRFLLRKDLAAQNKSLRGVAEADYLLHASWNGNPAHTTADQLMGLRSIASKFQTEAKLEEDRDKAKEALKEINKFLEIHPAELDPDSYQFI